MTIDDVRAWLSRQNKSALVNLLVEHATEDDRLFRRLLAKAGKPGRKGPDVDTYERMLDGALDTGGFVEYQGASDYASGIDDAIDAIEELLDEGYTSESIDLCEYALRGVEGALEFVDDSDGYMGTLMNRLQEIHLEACRKAKPDPEALARRLFTWELETEWDTFFDAADTYGSILGKKGLDVYRQLAQDEWRRVPPLGRGGDVADGYVKRFRITHIMEKLARRTGDVEAVVAVKSRDLSSAYDYLQIAEAYRDAGKADLALDWAERGLEAFPERSDPRLREFLANEYHRRKRHDEAMALVWTMFEETPNLDRYKNLKRHADKSGEWKTWRLRALDAFQHASVRAIREHGTKPYWFSPRDHSELVRVFLWEKDLDSAWREAVAGGCSDALWMELAAQRERDRPEEVLPVYQRLIEPTLQRKNQEAYRGAVGLLRKVRGLMVRLDREPDFVTYLELVRAAHKRKRNFMKLLDRARGI
jgi:tetratricopeptide (TPR) repeat protein